MKRPMRSYLSVLRLVAYHQRNDGNNKLDNILHQHYKRDHLC